MPALTRPQKITLGEMRATGVRGLLVYCSDYKCSHWTAISGDKWPDGVRLSDIEPRFICQSCGQKGADVRPNFHWEREARRAKVARVLAIAGDCAMNRYEPNTPDELRQVLNGDDPKLKDDMAVEADPDSGITATTVGDLRKLTVLPPSRITLTIPRPIYPESVVKVEKRDPS